MWYPHVGEQCPFLHPLASLSDLEGHGVVVRGRGKFARRPLKPYAIREGLGLLPVRRVFF
jgi:hypothetical protein